MCAICLRFLKFLIKVCQYKYKAVDFSNIELFLKYIKRFKV